MNFNHVAARVTLAIAATAIMSACSDDDNDGSSAAATSEVPASASESAAGFIGYLQALVVTVADTLEPVETSMVTPPTDELSEPIRVD